MQEAILSVITTVNEYLWSDVTFVLLLASGILFTIWTKFCQAGALTHGIQVIRGVYDDPNDPGAINHFQALSAALSATVGLGNIGGVALAIAAGGPGAVFWMWIVGVLGMALKTVEITLAMMYRNTEDPENPHGGAMWVIDKTLGARGGIFWPLAKLLGGFFCVTTLVSTITGGNMFQAWNVAELTDNYFGFPRVVTGIVLAILVGLVIIGGIKRIGRVAGHLVPLMCVLYLVSGLAVIFVHAGDVPATLLRIVTEAFSPTEAHGAFLGGTLGFAFAQGLKRALFSNEAGQGSAPMAHAAAKTDEPAREGIVGGLGPFIDTILICTLTALVILLTDTWQRETVADFDGPAELVPAWVADASPLPAETDGGWQLGDVVVLDDQNGPDGTEGVRGTIVPALDGTPVVAWEPHGGEMAPDIGDLSLRRPSRRESIGTLGEPPAFVRGKEGENLLWTLPPTSQAVPEEQNAVEQATWENMRDVFVVVTTGAARGDTGTDRYRLYGQFSRREGSYRVYWGTIAGNKDETPALVDGGFYREFTGASLTAHAFDREFPGLGKWLVTLAAWLFAFSTMISWSYYGEQALNYLIGNRGVTAYKLLFCVAAAVAPVAVTTDRELGNLIDFGTGWMLWGNMPIVLLMSPLAVGAIADYYRRLRAGEFHPHAAPSLDDVMEGKDVE